jgi:hypothetical protein
MSYYNEMNREDYERDYFEKASSLGEKYLDHTPNIYDDLEEDEEIDDSYE